MSGWVGAGTFTSEDIGGSLATHDPSFISREVAYWFASIDDGGAQLKCDVSGTYANRLVLNRPVS